MTSASSTQYRFPAPIGGVPLDIDFVPSVLFAVLYACVSLLAFYRMARPSTRSIFLIGTLIYVTERTVLFSLRAKAAHDPSMSTSTKLTKYCQANFANGYIGVLTSVGALLATLLVRATRPPSSTTTPEREDDGVSKRTTPASAQPLYSLSMKAVDRKRTRIVYRVAFGHLTLFKVLALILAIVHAARYIRAETDVAEGNRVQVLRYISASLALLSLLLIHTLALRAYLCEPRISRRAVLLLATAAMLLTLTAVYRLGVMRFRTPALTALGFGTLNGTRAKTAFYVLHIVPELLAAVLVCGVNVNTRAGEFSNAASGAEMPVRGAVEGVPEANELKSLDQGKSKDTVQIAQIPV